ncbi:hypothetical protein ACFE04_015989 [Oxalis oulophora]
MADTFIHWIVNVGTKRNIPVISFFPMSASVFSMFYNAISSRQMGTTPIDLTAIDQMPNGKQIKEDWKIGLWIKEDVREDRLVTRQDCRGSYEVHGSERNESKKMRARAKQLQEISRRAIAKDGSCEADVGKFIRDISQ